MSDFKFEKCAFPAAFPPNRPAFGFVFADANLPLPRGIRTIVPFANVVLLNEATSTGIGINVLEAGVYQVEYDLAVSFAGPGEYDFSAGISTDGSAIIPGSTSRISGDFAGIIPPTFVDQLNKTVLVQVFGPTTFSVIVSNNSTGGGAERIQLASLSVTQIA